MKVKKILVSQPKPSNDKNPYWDLAEQYGLSIDYHSFIKVEGITVKEFRQLHIDILDYTAIIFTSKIAIDTLFSLCKEMRITIPDTMKYFCVTESIALYLQKYIVYRKRKIHHGEKKIDDLTKYLLKNSDEKFLLPLSDVHKESIPAFLSSLKLDFTKAVFYRTVSANLKDTVKLENYNIIAFYTPAGIKSLFQNYPDFQQNDIAIAAFGQATWNAAEEAGLKINIKAPTSDFPSMTMALEDYIIRYNKEHKSK